MASELSKVIKKVIDYIDENIKKKRILCVHCAAGVSRSSSVVIAYLMIKKNMPLKQAFQLTWDKRSAIWPNQGFMKMLLEQEMKIYHKNSFTLEQYKKWSEY